MSNMNNKCFCSIKKAIRLGKASQVWVSSLTLEPITMLSRSALPMLMIALSKAKLTLYEANTTLKIKSIQGFKEWLLTTNIHRKVKSEVKTQPMLYRVSLPKVKPRNKDKNKTKRNWWRSFNNLTHNEIIWITVSKRKMWPTMKSTFQMILKFNLLMNDFRPESKCHWAVISIMEAKWKRSWSKGASIMLKMNLKDSSSTFVICNKRTFSTKCHTQTSNLQRWWQTLEPTSKSLKSPWALTKKTMARSHLETCWKEAPSNWCS